MRKFLFGTLDEGSEEVLKRLMEGTSNRPSVLANLLANQTELRYTEFGVLHAKAREFERALPNVTEEQVVAQKRAAFSVALELFSENVLQYELDMEILTDASPLTE